MLLAAAVCCLLLLLAACCWCLRLLLVVAFAATAAAQTYGKVNTIHWHLVDQQSFPFDSKLRPLLSQKGAYSDQERYTALDVAEVIEYGALTPAPRR